MKACRWLALCALVFGWACSGSTGTAGGGARPSQNLIMADEIQAQHFANAYEVINALRPSWLRSRSPTFGASGRSGVMIYLDNNRLGSVEYLRQIAAGQIELARFLPPTEATSRYGTNHADGAIVITSIQR
jgi:hypothetical protein